MFKARFKKYWCDFISEYKEITTNSIEDILEYVYKVHEDSVYPAFSRFYCRGSSPAGKGGYLEASCSLPEKYGYRGSMWLEKITYNGPNGEVIVFSRNEYISPKTSKAFDDFAEIAKQRGKSFGDY